MLPNDFNRSTMLKYNSPKIFLLNEFPKLRTPDPRKEQTGCKGLLIDLAANFGERTTIHGVGRLFDASTTKRMRILWGGVLLFALAMLIYVSLIIGARYNSKQLETVVDSTKFPVYQIPFPELTVCNLNRLNWSRLPVAMQAHLAKEHQGAPYEDYFVDVLLRYDTFNYGEFDAFTNFSLEIMQALNYVNFTTVVNFMSWRCDEVLQDCHWQHERYNCCDIFFPRKSQLGPCLAFNSLESEQGKRMQKKDAQYPWRVGQYGPGTALTLKMFIREKEHAPRNNNKKGINFMLGEPGVWHNFPIMMAAYTKVSVSVNSNINFYDNNTRGMRPFERGCLFEDEYNAQLYKAIEGFKYMYENCKSECQQRMMFELCNCSTDLFFPVGGYPVCQLIDMTCLAKHNDLFLKFERPDERQYVHAIKPGIKCNCLLNCYSIMYIPDVRSTFLELKDQLENLSYVEMDIYFRRSFTLSYKTARIFTWIDLLVSFGGVAGLFLGCSLISLVEIFYFCFVDMPKFLLKHRVERSELMKISPLKNKTKLFK